MGTKVTIIGLGLIGTSLGMALRRVKGADLEIVGHDKEPRAASRAHKMGAVDKTEWNLISAVREAGVVVLAIPVGAMGETFRQIAPHLVEHCIVTDTGSTKAQVLAWADQHLPATVSFVGGHPMAGKEKSGPEAAEANLFQGATYCIVPSVKAHPEAVQLVVGLANILGARPFFIDPQEHDTFVAAVSHLPIVLSSALVSATNKSPSWREMSRLVATGYKDVSRLASGDPEMNRDILMTNKEFLSHWIDAYIAELREYKRLMSESAEDLLKLFVRVWEARERVMQGVDMSGEARPFEKIPSAAETLLGSYVGGRLAETFTRVSQRSKELMGETGRKAKSKG